MVDIGRDDGTATRDFSAYKFGRYPVRDTGTKTVARVLFQQTAVLHLIQQQVLADGSELHFRCNDALFRIMHLRDIAAAHCAARLANMLEAQVRKFRISLAFITKIRARTVQQPGIIAFINPAGTHIGQAPHQVNRRVRVRVRTGSIIDGNRRVLLDPETGRCVVLLDLPHGYADIRARTFYIDFCRAGKRSGNIFRQLRGFFNKFFRDRTHLAALASIMDTEMDTRLADA